MTKLTEHFTLEELYKSTTATNKGINNYPCKTIQAKLKTLAVTILEPIRKAWGAPIIVSSGYRCYALNKAVGGSSISDHMYGCAADIHTVSDSVEDNKKLYQLIRNLVNKKVITNMKQAINEYNYDWIHISYQDGRSTKRNQFIAIGG